MKQTTVLLLLLALAGAARAADSLNVRLIGGCALPGEAFDVAVSGDHAYVACGDSGLHIVSIADPSHPSEVGFLNTPGRAGGVVVSGDYAYLAVDTAGLLVVSVSDPTHPAEVARCNTPGQAYGLTLEGHYVYVADGSSGLRVISIADPAHPQEVGYCDTLGGAVAVAVVGDYAYLTGPGTRLCAVSVADPARPALVSRSEGEFGLEVEVSGYYAYVGIDPWVIVMRVADPLHLFEVARYGVGDEARGIAVSGGLAYVAAAYHGMRVLSVTDPARPFQVGFYDLTGFSGWTNGVTASGGYAYNAYGEEGLQVFQFFGSSIDGDAGAHPAIGPLPTVVRRALWLPSSLLTPCCSLLSIDGRTVIELQPGPNDLSRLAPGVYFVRTEPTAVSRQSLAVTKVIVAE